VSEHREEFLDLCAGYALRNLDDADRQRLEEHLAGRCATCEEALAGFAEATVLLAGSAPSTTPDPLLRARVLEAVPVETQGAARASQAGRPVPIRPAPWTGLAWAAAAALAVASALTWSAASRLQRELEASRQELTRLEQRLAEEQRWIEVLNAPGARVADLALTPQAVAELRARATYDPRTRRAVLMLENFRAPAGRDYELWALQGRRVASLGVIRADEHGRAVMRIENAGDPATLAGFTISLEPAGGSPDPGVPSGPVVMAGKFGG
jgi:anti-sigma-K factor RskA